MDLDRTAFTLDGERRTLGDVLGASYLGGWTRPLEARLRDDLARQAIATERGTDPEPEDLQGPLDAWRMDRDLVAADELEAWLEDRGLELGDVVEHLERVMLRRMRCSEPELARAAPPPGDVLALLAEELTLSGEAERLAEQVARRAVAARGDASSAEAPAPPDETARLRVRRELLHDRGVDAVEELEDALDAFDLTPERLGQLLDLEVDYRLFEAQALSLGRLRSALDDFRDHLVRLEVASATCPTEDVAREIICCVRVDEDSFARSVARAGLPCRSEVAYLSDVSRVAFGPRLPTTPAKGLLGPEPSGGGRHLVGQLVDRREPDLSSPEVVEKLRERLLDRLLKVALSERVRFPAG